MFGCLLTIYKYISQCLSKIDEMLDDNEHEEYDEVETLTTKNRSCVIM